MGIDYHTGRIGEALEAVVDQIQTTRETIAAGNVTGCLYDIDSGDHILGLSATQLTRAVTDIYVPATNEPGTSNVTRYPGYFCVDKEVLGAFTLLNQRKAALRDVAAEAKAQGMSWREFRSSFAAVGYGNVHALQLTREFVILPGDIRALGFTVTGSMQSMRNMSLDECLEWLDKAGAGDVISLLYDRGYTQNTQLRVSRPVATHVRVNVFPQEGRASQFKSSVPVIIDNPDWEGRVTFNKATYRDTKRSDAREFRDSIPLPFINKGYLHIEETTS